jgi:hypothetical protein
MPSTDTSAHDRAIADQFTRQASGLACSPELHAGDVLKLIVDRGARWW